MPADILTLDLRLRVRAMIGYTAGMAVYAFIIVALYPTFKNDTSLNQFSGSTAAALFGVSGSLTSPSGWLNANLYANFVPLILLLLSIGYGSAAIAGQAEDGTLALVVTLPVSRSRVALEKFAAMCLQALPVSVVTALCVLAGRGFDLPVSIGGLIGITLGAFSLGIFFGSLAMWVGAATGSRGVSLAVASTVAAAAYLISSLAPVIRWLRPARYASPFYWTVDNAQVSSGLSPGGVALIVAATGICVLATLHAFRRLDVR